MQTMLVISALGQDRPGIVNDVSEIISAAGGNITESRMTVLGGEFALIMLVTGAPAVIDAIEKQLDQTQHILNLVLLLKRTGPRQTLQAMLPFHVEVVSMDHPGIVSDVTEFFSKNHINIEELTTSSYAAPHTGTPMFALKMNIGIPSSLIVSKIRNQFFDFCDELNLDATWEAIKV